jgi:hypothetical protein
MADITMDGNSVGQMTPPQRRLHEKSVRERAEKARAIQQMGLGNVRLTRNVPQQEEMRSPHEHVVPMCYGVPMEDENYRYATVENPEKRRVFQLEQKGWEMVGQGGHALHDPGHGVFVFRQPKELAIRMYQDGVANVTSFVGDHSFSRLLEMTGQVAGGDLRDIVTDTVARRPGHSIDRLHDRLPDSTDPDLAPPDEQ